MKILDKPASCVNSSTRGLTPVLFVLIQMGIMLLAISNESLWIDEFWTAHFATLDSLRSLYDLMMIPGGSQTPLHFLYFYAWELLFQHDEFSLRLANMPLFVLGQLSLFLALRTYGRNFSFMFLTICALHPLVWQYANEARPYIMMYAGSQMILAYILNLRASGPNIDRVSPFFSAVFVVGGILLFGASMLGAFWVLAACAYVADLHARCLNWRYLTRGIYLLLLVIFLTAITILAVYYVSNVLSGGGASRLSSTTTTTVLFAAYEVLGLSGVGPGRLGLRDIGIGAFGPYIIWMIGAASVLLFALFIGVMEMTKILGRRDLIVVIALVMLPIGIVIFSGFVMHWRVLGRHLIATLPILNMLFALGLVRIFETDNRRDRVFRSLLGVAFLLVFIYSSLSLRFADRHRKDDYRTAAAIAQENDRQGKRVWWAADYVGANYYKLPGEFDYMSEITGKSNTLECVDRPGVQSIANATKECLDRLTAPDIIILSKPDLFDRGGEVVAYLNAHGFARVRDLPAFTIWRSSEHTEAGALE